MGECSYTLDSSKEVIVRERFTGGITVRGKAGEECNLLKSVFYSFPNTFLIDAVIKEDEREIQISRSEELIISNMITSLATLSS